MCSLTISLARVQAVKLGFDDAALDESRYSDFHELFVQWAEDVPLAEGEAAPHQSLRTKLQPLRVTSDRFAGLYNSLHAGGGLGCCLSQCMILIAT